MNWAISVNRDVASKFAFELLNEFDSVANKSRIVAVDHLCFRTETFEEYQSLCRWLVSDQNRSLECELLTESMVNGRMISTFKFREPVRVDSFLIECLEVPAPKPSVKYHTGFEHIECLFMTDFFSLSAWLKACNIAHELPSDKQVFNPELQAKLKTGVMKFHHLPLSAIVAIENDPGFSSLVGETGLLKVLGRFKPMPSGSVPIDVALEDSDFDLLLECPADLSLEEAVQDIAQILNVDASKWKPFESRDGRALVLREKFGGRRFELFLCQKSVLEQSSHRHLISEYRLLLEHGSGLRKAVINYKDEGLTTEEAFAKALGLKGDPYIQLLM